MNYAEAISFLAKSLPYNQRKLVAKETPKVDDMPKAAPKSRVSRKVKSSKVSR